MISARCLLVMLTLFFGGLPLHGEEATADHRPGFLGFAYTCHRDGEESRWLVVRMVAAGGPAEKAGLRGGDRITGIADADLRFDDDLDVLLLLGKAARGKPFPLQIVRGGATHRLVIIPGAMTDRHYEQWKTTREMLEEQRARRDKNRN